MTVLAPGYTASIFDARKRNALIDRCCDVLRTIDIPDLRTIATCGNSGLLGAMVAAKMGLDLISVRKEGSRGHDTSDVNGPLRGGSYIFIDDLIDSGRTLERVHRLIREAESVAHDAGHENPKSPTFAGVLLYHQNIFDYSIISNPKKIYNGDWDRCECWRSTDTKKEVPTIRFWTIEWQDLQ